MKYTFLIPVEVEADNEQDARSQIPEVIASDDWAWQARHADLQSVEA